MKVTGLKKLRLGRQLSTRELALIADVDRKTVEGVEAGRRSSPRMRTMRKIAAALGVEAAAISEFRAALQAAEGK